MSHEEYWKGDPGLVQTYAEAYRLKIEEKNHELWMQGLYVYEALIAVASRFGNKKQGLPEFPSKPHRVTPMTEAEKRQEEAAEIQKERERVVKLLNSLRPKTVE